MRITKLPNKIDPTYLIREKIREQNKTCPFCGESESTWDWLEKHNNGYGGVACLSYKSWYGKKDHKLFEKKHHWRIDNYKCYTCGAEWESDSYPIDITGIPNYINN